ncbi:uncharacterized protein LOC127108105 [Lathyrus oleraceus]|uniref:uncharacterized protein LOC127108105 n=1 Tax=Pisum sativum TaxID=3888 RepID=UPI0021D00EC9|nr:uncharacterized protein LOC127108105 [Pisum sativum]
MPLSKKKANAETHFFFSLVQSIAACFFSFLEACRCNRTTVLCTVTAEHENHHILSPSAPARAAVVAPAVMSESDHPENSDADTHKSATDTHKSVDTGDSGQPKNTTFRGSKSEFHPALALFRIHAHSHRVLHHIVPSIGKERPAITDANHEQWSTLDATVLQWIYSTISTDLLTTILEPNSTAIEAWNRLEDIFQDNQNARAVILEQEFSNTRMEDFTNVSAYCQRLKMLSDQLRNVGSPMNNHLLVVQLIYGLPEAYRSVATLICQRNPLPTFYQARSMLTLEEASMAKMENTGSHAAMHTTQLKPTEDTSQRGNRRPDNRSRSRGNQGHGEGRGNHNALQYGVPSTPSLWSAPPWQQ